MISNIPEKTLCYNEGDVLPVEGIENGKFAFNLDTGEIKVFNLVKKEWKTL